MGNGDSRKSKGSLGEALHTLAPLMNPRPKRTANEEQLALRANPKK
jgi:hypothetical protein